MSQSISIDGRVLSGRRRSRPAAGSVPDFEVEFAALFGTHFPRLFRYLDRLTGDPELAADLAQDAFLRLHLKGNSPDAPGAWLVSVAMNLLRNAESTRSRRRRLLTPARMERACADPPPPPDRGVAASETRRHVRAALERLPERERQLLLLRAEGYSYCEMATALHLNEASVGVMLARAKAAFRAVYGEVPDAP